MPLFLGGKKILLFCSKIKKEDIEVLFKHYGKGKNQSEELSLTHSIIFFDVDDVEEKFIMALI